MAQVKYSRYPCPVCCRYFCRDKDMILADDYYVCESSFWEEYVCDFSFPARLSDREINEAAEEHIKKIRGRV